MDVKVLADYEISSNVTDTFNHTYNEIEFNYS